MDSESTSVALVNSASEEWGRYLAFVKHPQLPDRASGISGVTLIATLRMLALDLLMMLGLILIAGLVLTLGFEFPDNEINALQWNMETIALVVLAAPLMEELAFRSWLSGRPGHVLAILLTGAGLLALGVLAARSGLGEGTALPGIAAIAAMLLAIVALFLLRKGGAMGWFARVFPLFFWLSTLGFAMVHLFNYTEGALPVLLPLVLPQLITGSILGYVRVHYGLWASVLLHALHNGMAVATVVLSIKLGLES